MITTTCLIGVRVAPSQTAWVTGRGTAGRLAGAALAADWMAATALAVRTAAAISTGPADLDLMWHPFESRPAPAALSRCCATSDPPHSERRAIFQSTFRSADLDPSRP